ncbi:plasmid pRiA4b ORF-3 family protein [Anaerotalea alkaliphila]|uniref:Plasmid pRiA4b ORF-3 family protein n=1 Tax=Anaerotalea alkaliphila TaxID=2662126 RepID=A0A7X5KLA2_9FIRM|nr:plasmid pRiA4b ORF-3 family protein [Anaerotalea alkaliphila]NDL66484.1 plasmid pRiA4b ORF-3 family protein [Anaerotalea alkaliphila]
MHTNYRLKTYPRGFDKVYCVIEMDGGETLDLLHKAIQDAFALEEGHLYLFNMERAAYGPDSIYSPRCEDKRRLADRTSLDSLELKPRRKFLYLYDFGEDMEFHVEVKKVWESKEKGTARVVEVQRGFPLEDLDPDVPATQQVVVEEIQDSMEDLLEMQRKEDLLEVCSLLGIRGARGKRKRELAEAVAGRLKGDLHLLERALDALSCMALSQVLDGSIQALETVGEMELNHLVRLEELGLLRLRGVGNLTEPCVCQVPAECRNYFQFYLNAKSTRENILRLLRTEEAMLFLMNSYGVLEKEVLLEMCGTLAEAGHDLAAWNPGETVPFLYWNGMEQETDDETVWVTMQDREVVEFILENRRELGCGYKKGLLEDYAKKGEVDLSSRIPAYQFLGDHILEKMRGSEVSMYTLLYRLIGGIHMGAEDGDLYLLLEESLELGGGKLDREVQKAVSELRREMPNASLGGWSWREWEEKNGIGRIRR